MSEAPHYDPTSWPFIRTCQECGHKAEYKDVATYKGTSWQDVKCKSCKSAALDYGSKRPWTEQQKAEYAAYEEWENAQP